MVNKGVSLREISRILKISRNTVRNVIKRGGAPESVRKTKYIERLPVIRELFRECRGNIVRVREELESRHGIAIPYQTLTWIIRNHGGWLEANWWENKWFQSLGLMFPWI